MKNNSNTRIWLLLLPFFFGLTSISKASNNSINPPFTNYLDDNGFIDLTGLQYNADSIFEHLEDSLGLSNDCNFVKYRDNDLSDSKYVLWYLEQEHKGIPIVGARMIMKSEKSTGYVLWIYGDYHSGLNLNTNSPFTDSAYVDSALAHLGDSVYAWEDSTMQALLIAATGDINSTYYPAVESKFDLDNNMQLTFTKKLYIKSAYPRRSTIVTIDAQTASIVRTSSGQDGCNGDSKPASGLTQSNGTQSFLATECDNGDWHLIDQSRNITTTRSDGTHIDDDNGSWDNNAQNKLGVSAHWCSSKAHDYFATKHYFARGGDLQVQVPNTSGGDAYRAAFYEYGDYIASGQDIIYYGYSQYSNVSIALTDLAGHEYTHLVIAHTSDLGADRLPEGRMLSEGLCDIFGVIIRSYAENQSVNWKFAPAVSLGVRDLKDGGQTGYYEGNTYKKIDIPTLYQDQLWISNENNTAYPSNTEPYWKSGVLRKWFQLLYDGGIQNGIKVESVDETKLMKLMYHFLKSLTNSSDYHDARAISVRTASDLFGPCSYELRQVNNSWDAVNVAINSNQQGLPKYSPGYEDYSFVFSTGPTHLITQDHKINSQIVVPNGSTLTIDNCTVSFGDRLTTNNDFNIVVEPGGRLVIKNSTLTAMPNEDGQCNLWGGILVKGLGSGTDQGHILTSTQGVIEIEHSIIEFARQGVQVGNTVSNGGGIAVITGSHFNNCKRGVQFFVYEAGTYPTSNWGRITSTNFLNDQPISGHSQQNLYHHISLFGVQGIRIHGNNFTNNILDYTLHTYDANRGIGITSWDASFNVDRITLPSDYGTNCAYPSGPKNVFKGLSVGINIDGTVLPSAERTVHVRNCEFIDNYIHIANHGQANATVWNNNFDWTNDMNLVYAPGVRLHGIRSWDAVKFTYADNEINCSNDQFFYKGMVIRNSGHADPSFVGSNQFELNPSIKNSGSIQNEFDYLATDVYGSNSSLYLNCNEYDNFIVDWRVNSDDLPNQEGQLGGMYGAGNDFSSPCNTIGLIGHNKYQVANIGSNPLDYYYSTSAPACTLGVVTTTLGTNGLFPNCLNSSYIDPDSYYCGSNNSGERTRGQKEDLNFFENLKNLSAFEQEFYSIELSNFSSSIKNEASLSECDKQLFKLLNKNFKLGRSYANIQDSIALEIYKLANNEQCGTNNTASRFYRHFIGYINTNEHNYRIDQSFASNSSDSELKQSDIILYPNPSRNIAIIESNNNLSQITVYNSVGIEVKNIVLDPKQKVAISTTELAPGIYILKIQLENGSRKTISVIKQ